MLSILTLAVVFGVPSSCPHLHLAQVRPGLSTKPSIARGENTKGWLSAPAKVPLKGPTLAVLPDEHRTRNRQYGTSELVNLLWISAQNLAEKNKGITTFVGDLSAVRGGKISGHASHQSGLDVDVAFFYRDEAGKLIREPAFWPVLEDGSAVAPIKATLDADLTWALMYELMTSAQAEVQWLFVSTPIKKKLLEAAHKANAPAEIIRRAETMLLQPKRSPHDDHFHLRIYCPPSDRLEGCVDKGPVWDWVVQPPPNELDREL